MTPPDRLFHATAPANAERIAADGIRPGFDGVIYLGTSPEVCMAFMWSRIAHRAVGIEEMVLPDADPADYENVYGVEVRDGKVIAIVPKIETNDHAVIFEIDTSALASDLLEISRDHAVEVFGADVSWAYAAPIPLSALVGRPRKMAPVS